MWGRTIGPYIGADPIAIAREVWAYLQSEVSIGVIIGTETTGGKVKVGTPAVPESEPGAGDEVEADPFRVDWWENRQASSVIDDLSDAANGFDYRIDVRQHPNGTRTKRLRFGYPRLGRRLSEMSITSGPLVRATPSERIDGSFIANHVLAVGAGEGRRTLHTHHRSNRAGAPKLDAVAMWKDETNVERLRRRGESELQARQIASSVPSLTVAADLPSLPLGSYLPGDDVWLDIEDGWTDYTGWARIMGWRLNPEADEVELDLARADLFQYGPAPDIGESQ